VPRARGIGFDLPAQALHVNRHGRRAAERVPPDLLEQLAPIEDLPGVLHQECEQVELQRRQVDQTVSDRDRSGARIEQDRADLDRLAVAPWSGSPEDRAHPRQELARRERLDDVVVGAELQARDPVTLLAARREHHHG
jgi:hypothetical protein